MNRLLAAYRSTGADPPFGDPAAAHGITFEGYYWRFTDLEHGRAVIALCGACRAPDGPWAVVAVAAHPGGFLRWEIVPHVWTDPRRLGVRAGNAIQADAHRLRVRLGGAELDAEIDPVVTWPRSSLGALGPAHLIPGLHQYWHPHLPRGTTRGTARLGDDVWSLDGASAYEEKNWGSAFADHWWWGQAHGLGGEDVGVAFAGGRLKVGSPSCVVVWLDGQMVRMAPPLAQVVTASEPGRWRIRARGAVHSVELEAHADPAAAHVLPVPVIAERRAELRSHQHLAGHLEVTVRRGSRVLFSGATELAGLERGTPA